MKSSSARRLQKNGIAGIVSAAVPVALALLPLLRKKMGWKAFSIPGIALFGGLWFLERRLKHK